MSIHTNRLESGRVTYTVRYRDHADEQQRRTFRTKAEAKDFELNISIAKANRSTTTAYVKRAQTFRDVADAALASVADDDRKDKTRDG